ncbi:hypothetical protein RRG08_056058 [Elysia crispata]|uniref:Uncharacterized protein n=1 Tax=Elysia crispata TaxID=231223 RepID=A0AAE0ZBE6_9GAST|nr:hypothetical protein RRG08_056058 [Elysia crispata]
MSVRSTLSRCHFKQNVVKCDSGSEGPLEFLREAKRRVMCDALRTIPGEVDTFCCLHNPKLYFRYSVCSTISSYIAPARFVAQSQAVLSQLALERYEQISRSAGLPPRQTGRVSSPPAECAMFIKRE